jgi:hypothetical protein
MTVSEEKFGKLTSALYIAEYQRMVRKLRLDTERKLHPCKFVEHEFYESDAGSSHMFCYRSANPLKFEDWCANCKFVEPYYQFFKSADENASTKRYNLRRVLKRKVIHALYVKTYGLDK